MRVLRKEENMLSKRVVGMLIILILTIYAVLLASKLAAQDGTPYHPIPTITNLSVRCDYDNDHKDMYVKFFVEQTGHYRVQGNGPGLPADYAGLYADVVPPGGWHGNLSIIANNTGGGQESLWTNLHLEFYQAYAQPDGTYTHAWVPFYDLPDLDCRTPLTAPPTPIMTLVYTPEPTTASLDGLNLGQKLNTDSTYAVFAGSFGIRVYALQGNRLGALLCVTTPVDVQRIAANPTSAVILAITDDHRVVIYRESDGRFGIRLKTDQGEATYTVDRLA
jgi:hypothetical protein